MNRICLIGNSGLKSNDHGGQTTKVRLYLKKINDEGFDVDFIDLENFSHHPFSILRKIKKGIQNCDRVVLISAERGCKVLIPYINRINKKLKKPFILPLIGISIFHFAIDHLNDEQKNDVFINQNFSLCKKNKKINKQLSLVTFILPETKILAEIFQNFYHLNNVVVLNNFRDYEIKQKNNYLPSSPLKIVYISRVMTIKGIFDLLEVVKRINSSGTECVLDIYGEKHLTITEQQLFDEYLGCSDINYIGSIENGRVIDTFEKYDLFVFPTRYLGEGTPGVIAESLISGTPILSSDFPQAKLLMNDGFDSFFFKMFDRSDLEQKLFSVIDNKDALVKMSYNSSKSGERFTYSFNRNLFLKYICGIED